MTLPANKTRTRGFHTQNYFEDFGRGLRDCCFCLSCSIAQLMWTVNPKGSIPRSWGSTSFPHTQQFFGFCKSPVRPPQGDRGMGFGCRFCGIGGTFRIACYRLAIRRSKYKIPSIPQMSVSNGLNKARLHPCTRPGSMSGLFILECGSGKPSIQAG